MTSSVETELPGSTMADINPSASPTPLKSSTLNNDHTNVIPTSSEDVATTQAQFYENQPTASHFPFSIGSPSLLDGSLSDLDISSTQESGTSSEYLPVPDVNPTVQSVPPSWILSSATDSGTEYSAGSQNLLSSTPSLPLSVMASKTDNIDTFYSSPGRTSDVLSTSVNVHLSQSSQNVILTGSETPLVPTIKITMDTSVPKPGVSPEAPTESYKTKWSHVSTSSVITTSSIVPGILPRGTTTYSVGTKDDKTVEPQEGFANSTILFIVVPVCLVVFLILIVVLVTCIRRRKKPQKPTNNQNPDLWVNTRPEISLVPTTPSVIETPTEAVPGFKPGDIVCRVVYPFTAQLDGQMSLTEQDLVKILEKADNGWWRGASQDEEQSGWFPGCYVEEVKPGADLVGEGSQSKGKSRVSSFMLKKRERIRRKSATAVSPLATTSTSSSMSTSTTMPTLNSAEINKFSEGKVFKALFAYRGSSKGELSIEEGDIVRGWEKDRNGWMHGRKVMTGEEGWFPAVYVDEVPSDSSSVSGESTLSGPVMYDQLAPNKNRQSGQEWLGIEHRAIHSYDGKSDSDLTFKAGDIIVIFDTLDNGWWLGSRGDDVGWLPGSYLEVLDSGREDESRSDVSSLISSMDDRSRTLDEDLSQMTSSQSLSSTLSDSKPKPKPVRKAPPPPRLKPLKIPARDTIQGSNFKSELKDVTLQSPDKNVEIEKDLKSDKKISKNDSISSKSSSSKPRRPAPPPPPKRTPSQSQPHSPYQESLSSTVAPSTASSVSDTKLKAGEKPYLPKRFAKPKVIRVPRQSSKLQNLAVNSRPSSRPAPPRPPPPKIPKPGTVSSKVRSSHSLSGIYTKSTDSTFGKSLSNSVKDLQTERENNNFPNDSVSFEDEVNSVDDKNKTSQNKAIISDKENSNKPNIPVNRISLESSISRSKSESGIETSQDNEDTDQSKRVPLYPLETGQTVSTPVILPVTPPVVPPVKTHVVPQVLPPKAPRAQPPARPMLGPSLHKSSVIPVPPPVVPRTSTLTVQLAQSSPKEREKPKDIPEASSETPESQEKTPDVAQPSNESEKTPDVAQPSNESEKTPDVAQPSNESEKPPDVAQPSNESEKPPDVAQPSNESEKPPDVAQPSNESEKPPDVAQPSNESETQPESPRSQEEIPESTDHELEVIVPELESEENLADISSETSVESAKVPRDLTPEGSPIAPAKLPRTSPPRDVPKVVSGSEVPVLSTKPIDELPPDSPPVVPPASSPESPQISIPINLPVPRIASEVPRSASPADDGPVVPLETYKSESQISVPVPQTELRPIVSSESQNSLENANQVPKTLNNKPVPPPKPNRVPPPVLPKPKIRPKPTGFTVYGPTNPDFNKDIPQYQIVSDGTQRTSPDKEVLKQVEEKQLIKEGNVDTVSVETSELESELETDQEGVKSDHNIISGEDGDGENIHDSDDEHFESNCDISSDSSATENSSSIASDTLDLGSEIGESDDHTLDSSQDVITDENHNEESLTENHTEQDPPETTPDQNNVLHDSPHHESPGDLSNGLSNITEEIVNGHPEKPSLNKNVTDSLQDDLSEQQTEASYETPIVHTETPHDQSSENQSETTNNQNEIPKSENQNETPNGQSESIVTNDEQTSTEHRPEETIFPNGTKSDKPVPVPRSGLSPKKERSPVPPARPPPPKSPVSTSYRKINKPVTDKSKKRTLRRATKSYVPVGKGELAFEEGSFIKEMSKAIGRPGWCIGMLADGTTGLYPTSHVQEYTSSRQSDA